MDNQLALFSNSSLQVPETAVQLSLFDYASLDSDTRAFVQEKARDIHARMKRTAEDIIEIGKDLIAVKTRLLHGQFIPWLKTEFEMSESVATKFMQVAHRFGEGNKSVNFTDLSASVLYAIAAPSTPNVIVQEVLSNTIPSNLQVIKDEKSALSDDIALENIDPKDIPTRFDYEVLDTEDREYVFQKTNEAYGLLKRTEDNIIRTGQIFTDIKALLKEKYGHGHWLAWLRDEIKIGPRTAQRFMRIAKTFPNASALTHLNLSPDSAFMVLTELSSTPQVVVQQVLSGEVPANTKAIQEAKEKAEREAKQAKEETKLVRKQFDLFREDVELREQTQKLTLLSYPQPVLKRQRLAFCLQIDASHSYPILNQY